MAREHVGLMRTLALHTMNHASPLTSSKAEFVLLIGKSRNHL